MNRTALDLLVDPVSGAALTLDAAIESDGTIRNGTLRSSTGAFPIVNGIPRFAAATDIDQQATSDAFALKWERCDTYDAPEVRRTIAAWMARRHGFADPDAFAAALANHSRVLDAGCGSAFGSSLCMGRCWAADADVDWYGLEISRAIDLAQACIGVGPRRHFVQGDILRLPFRPASFDLVFAEGSLHHTPSTQRAFVSLAAMVAPGGELFCYIYRKKSPIREFADDYVRGALAALPPEEAWDALRPLTALARTLSELHAEIVVEEPIPFLGIPAGRHDVQRLIYWHLLKLFWNDDFSFEQNNHVNFDWYAPRYAHRHTDSDVRRWCADANLTVEYLDTTDQAGLTLHARRRAT